VLAQGAAFADPGAKSDEGWTMVVSTLLLGLVLVAESVSVVDDAQQPDPDGLAVQLNASS